MGLVIPVTGKHLTGELRKRLSYQVATERMDRDKRLAVIARKAEEIKRNRTGWRKNLKFLCEVPGREYFRIQQEVDTNFFRSVKDIKRYLVSEHPELKGGVGT
jgi:hypothetical protein